MRGPMEDSLNNDFPPFLHEYYTKYTHRDLTIPSHSQCDIFIFASSPKRYENFSASPR